MDIADRHFEHLDPSALHPSPALWVKAWNLCLAAVIAGGVGTVLAWPMNPEQFYHSWLTSWSFCWTLLCGVLFFVMLHHLVDAGWSTVIRRPAEQLLVVMPIILLAAIPALIGLYSGRLHRWVDAPPDDTLLTVKRWYLNIPFLTGRLILYTVILTFLARLFRTNSLRQDVDGAARWTLSSRRWSAGGMPLYALAVSFGGFDMLMALDHHWFSTIFGVYLWTGAVAGALCLLMLITLSLKSGPLHEYIGSDQIHDLGKLLFAFVAFWGYIAFSQYFLVWYSNIPEETVYYLNRWTGDTPDGHASWWVLSLLMPALRFVLPFFILMSAHMKRNARVLVPTCFILLAGHWLDQYWIVQPSLSRQFPPIQYLWMDLSALALIIGLCGLLFIRTLRQAPLLPIMDPRLVEALSAEHVEEIEHADQE